jgi:DNA-binding response OmpR family regulator
MPKPRVLIIDDEKLLVKSTCMGLKLHGLETQGALSGEEGLRMAREQGADVILLDIMMPGMDGWEVLAQLKGEQATASIPVVVFTAKEYSSGGALARENGAADFLAKPFELDELAAVVQRHVSSGRKGTDATA